MAAPRTLLLTRPRAQSEAFAAVLAAELPGRFRPVVSPILEIVPLPAPLDLDGLQGLIFTSANGVEQFAARSPDRSLPAWCVGEMTAAAARRAGLRGALGGRRRGATSRRSSSPDTAPAPATSCTCAAPMPRATSPAGWRPPACRRAPPRSTTRRRDP